MSMDSTALEANALGSIKNIGVDSRKYMTTANNLGIIVVVLADTEDPNLLVWR